MGLLVILNEKFRSSAAIDAENKVIMSQHICSCYYYYYYYYEYSSGICNTNTINWKLPGIITVHYMYTVCCRNLPGLIVVRTCTKY